MDSMLQRVEAEMNQGTVDRRKLQHKKKRDTVPALGDHPGTLCNV
jgi:hypothetical protein